MAGLGALTIDLVANVSRFERALTRAERLADKRSKTMVRHFKRAATGIGLALTSLGLIKATEKAFNFADAMGKAADRAGVSTDRLQEMRFAMDQFGVTTQQTDDGLRRFTRRLGVALEGGSFKKGFDELNVAIRDTNGEFRGTEAVLDDVMDALAGYEDQATRSAFAAQLFGDDAGPQMSLALAQGGQAMRDYAAKAHATGAIMRADIIDAAEQANDRLGELTTTLKVQLSTALIQSAPAIEAAAKGLVSLVSAIGKAIGGVSAMNMDEVKARVQSLGNSIADARAKLTNVEGLEGGGLQDRLLAAFLPDPETYKQRIANLELLQMEAFARMGEINNQAAERAKANPRNPLTGLTDEELAESNERTLSQMMWLADRSAEIDALMAQDRIANQQTVADFTASSYQSIQSNAVSLLQTLGRENKNYARAAIVLQKGLAIAQATINTAVAVTAALAVDPTGALAARVKAIGAVQIGLIAATGVAQLAALNSGPAGGAAGTAVNPVINTPVNNATGEALGGSRGTITINVNGVITADIINDLLIPAIQDSVDNRDVILIRNDSRNGIDLTAGLIT